MNKNKYKNNFILRLKNSGIMNPEQEFTWLACSALGVSSAELMTLDFNIQDCEKLNNFISRREKGEPLQYIIETGTFYGRDFAVGHGVLIPRPDTETLINAALFLFHDKNKNFNFLDWGTGSGCIAITILLERLNSKALMLDKSPVALDFARKNIKKYNLENRAELLLSSQPASLSGVEDVNNQSGAGMLRARPALRTLQACLALRTLNNFDFDFIISNPPYIPTQNIKNLMREVKDYEPDLALDGGADGMDYYKFLFQHAPLWLKSNGFLILEIGDENQSEFLKNYNTNFKFIKSFYDNSGFPRCMVWQLS